MSDQPVISVMLIVPDADAAVAWYREALGATVTWDLGGVAGLEIGGAPFFLHQINPRNPTEDSPDRIGGTSVRIELFVDDRCTFTTLTTRRGTCSGGRCDSGSATRDSRPAPGAP